MLEVESLFDYELLKQEKKEPFLLKVHYQFVYK